MTNDFWFLPTDDVAPGPNPAVVAALGPSASRDSSPPPSAPAAPAVATPTVPPAAPGTADRPPQYLRPPTTASATAPQAAPMPAGYAAPPRVSRVAEIRTLPVDDAYDLAIAEDSVDAYEAFLLAYPDDPRDDWVRTTLALRVDAVAWRYASVVNTPAAYEDYISRYPGGLYLEDATRLRVRPRLRVIDTVIAPRFIAPPPAPRIALPLIQTRRPAGAAIVLPVVASRPAHAAPGFAPARLGTGLNPGGAMPSASSLTAPSGLQRPTLTRPNLATTTPGQAGVPQNKPSNPTFHSNAVNATPGPGATQQPQNQLHGPGPLGPQHPNALNVPHAPGGPSQFHQPGAGFQPPVANVTPHAQPMMHPANPQFRPPAGPARVQAAVRPAPPAKCAGKGCKR